MHILSLFTNFQHLIIASLFVLGYLKDQKLKINLYNRKLFSEISNILDISLNNILLRWETHWKVFYTLIYKFMFNLHMESHARRWQMMKPVVFHGWVVAVRCILLSVIADCCALHKNLLIILRVGPIRAVTWTTAEEKKHMFYDHDVFP